MISLSLYMRTNAVKVHKWLIQDPNGKDQQKECRVKVVGLMKLTSTAPVRAEHKRMTR